MIFNTDGTEESKEEADGRLAQVAYSYSWPWSSFFGRILIFVLNMRLFCQREEYQGEGLQHWLHQVTV